MGKNESAKYISTDIHESIEEQKIKLLAVHTQCHFFMERKRRYCNQEKIRDSVYCGNHRYVAEGAGGAAGAAGDNNKRLSRLERESGMSGAAERIPCPIDPTHTVYKHRLKKHLHICVSARKGLEMTQKPFFCEDCNSGRPNEEGTKKSTQVDPTVLLEKVQRAFSEYVDAGLLVNEGGSSSGSSIFDALQVCTSQERAQEVATANKDSQAIDTKAIKIEASRQEQQRSAPTSFFRARHGYQEQAICHIMTQWGMLSSPGSTSCNIVELGAGRGGLGLAVHREVPQATLVLVERNGQRKKVDKEMRDVEREGRFHRVKMDIRHCLLSGLPGLLDASAADSSVGNSQSISTPQSPRRMVIVAKHLCGVASDLAINSLHDPALGIGQMTSVIDNPERGLHVSVAVATCCHHCCNYSDYSGREWIQGTAGITEDEYAVLVHWSGWATGHAELWSGRQSSHSEDRANKAHSRPFKKRKQSASHDDLQNISKDEKSPEVESNFAHGAAKHSRSMQTSNVPRPEGLDAAGMARTGFMIKRLLDHGRVMHLRSLGLHAQQVRFCSPRLTPECYLIVASSSAPIEKRLNIL